jgi:hypothetical protein
MRGRIGSIEPASESWEDGADGLKVDCSSFEAATGGPEVGREDPEVDP